ncbi:MAG: DUF421 domain-containing protein [Clostridia bacterium]|nr:DUF421 domain-containing protein [Clostridia bacterium]
MSDLVKVIIFALSAYATLFILSKLLGKKQIAQLTFVDYVVGISIGSIGAEMATETDKPFYHYLIAMALFFLMDLIVTLIGRKSPVLKRLISGKPKIIISEGKLDYQELKKCQLTVDEVIGLARDKYYFDLEDIAYAILETQGTLSILPKSNKTPVVAEDIDVQLPPAELTEYVIVDGRFNKDILTSQNLTKEEVLNKLHLSKENQISNILLAQYDENNDTMTVQFK